MFTGYRHVAALAGGAVVTIALAAASPAWADACDSHNWNIGVLPPKIPNCELQVQPPLKLSGLDTKGWAFYCTGSHGRYWGASVGFSPSFTFNNSCFSVAENITVEDANNGKFDATFTNWCFKTETVTVTLACTDQGIIPSPDH